MELRKGLVEVMFVSENCKARGAFKDQGKSAPGEGPAAAAAAKLLQSCPTLCNPIDGSPPGSAVPGILQARTLEDTCKGPGTEAASASSGQTVWVYSCARESSGGRAGASGSRETWAVGAQVRHQLTLSAWEGRQGITGVCSLLLRNPAELACCRAGRTWNFSPPTSACAE